MRVIIIESKKSLVLPIENLKDYGTKLNDGNIILKSQKYYVMINGEKVKCVIHALGGML